VSDDAAELESDEPAVPSVRARSKALHALAAIIGLALGAVLLACAVAFATALFNPVGRIQVGGSGGIAVRGWLVLIVSGVVYYAVFFVMAPRQMIALTARALRLGRRKSSSSPLDDVAAGDTVTSSYSADQRDFRPIAQPEAVTEGNWSEDRTE
jgi:hypothetical protein